MRFSYYLSLFILFYSPFCFSLNEHQLNKEAIADEAHTGELFDIITNAQHTPTNSPLSKYTGAFVLPLIVEQHSKALKDPLFNPNYFEDYDDARHLAQSGYISEAIALTPIIYPSDVLVALLLSQSSSNYIMVDVLGQNVDKDYFNVFYSAKRAMVSVLPLSAADAARRVNQTTAYQVAPEQGQMGNYGIIVPNASISGSSTAISVYNGSSWSDTTYTKEKPGTTDKNAIVQFYIKKLEKMGADKCDIMTAESEYPGQYCTVNTSGTFSEISGNNFYIYLSLRDRDGWEIWEAVGAFRFIEFSGSFSLVANPAVTCPDGTAMFIVYTNGSMNCRPDFTKDDSASLYASIGYTPDYEFYPNGSVKVHPTKVFSKTWPNFVSIHPDSISFYSPNNSNAEVVNRFHVYYKGDLKYKVDREVTGMKYVRDKFNRKDENGQEKYEVLQPPYFDYDLSFHYIYEYDSLGLLENLTVSYTGDALKINPESDSVTSSVFGLVDAPMVQQFGLQTLPAASGSGAGTSPGGSGSSSGGPACGYDDEHKCAVDFGDEVPSEEPENEEDKPKAPTNEMLKEAIFGKDFMKSFTGEGIISTDNGECPSVSLNLTNFLREGAFGKYDYDGHCQVLNKNLALLGGSTLFDFIRVMFVVSWLLIAIYRVLSA